MGNDYVIEGALKQGYNCPVSKSGAFVSYDGKQQIVKKPFDNEKQQAVKNKGYFFQQNLIIWDGDNDPTICPSAYSNQETVFSWRCLAYNDATKEFMVIQSPERKYKDFVEWLKDTEGNNHKDFKVTSALYLDMGAWSAGYYCKNVGDTIYDINTHQPTTIEQNKMQTNYLVVL